MNSDSDVRMRPDVDPQVFREAMCRFPSGVTIVTTRDADGRPQGFTASAFSSLSGSPPLVLACLDTSARCHAAFMAAQSFSVSILRPHHAKIAYRFASKVADKFTEAEFDTDAYGLPRLPDALVHLSCEAEQRVDGGDHTILIGRVFAATLGDGEPAAYFNRGFWRLRPETEQADATT